MNDLRGPTLIAMDKTIATLLSVIERYATDHRGPSANWCQQLADVVQTLCRARRLL